MLLAFIIWAVIGLFFVCMGIYCFFAKKPMGFWANAETFAVENVDGYNRAVGKMWIVYGIVFALLGLPMLSGSPLIPQWMGMESGSLFHRIRPTIMGIRSTRDVRINVFLYCLNMVILLSDR